MLVLKNGNYVDLGSDLKIPDDILLRFLDPKLVQEKMIQKGLMEAPKASEVKQIPPVRVQSSAQVQQPSHSVLK